MPDPVFDLVWRVLHLTNGGALDELRLGSALYAGAWLVGLLFESALNWGDIGLHVVLPVIVMGCCVMKYIKDSGQTK